MPGSFAWIMYWMPTILIGCTIIVGLVYFIVKRYNRRDQPTYDFPKDDEGAYKPILSESAPPESPDRERQP